MAEPHRDEIAKLEALFAANPDGRIFTHLAEAYRKAGDLARARETVESGLARHAEYPSAHVVLGRVLWDLGEVEGAEGAFRRVLELDPENRVALRALGDLARERGRAEEALEHYRALLLLDPSDGALDELIRQVEEQTRAPGGVPEAGGVVPGLDLPVGSSDPLGPGLEGLMEPLAGLEGGLDGGAAGPSLDIGAAGPSLDIGAGGFDLGGGDGGDWSGGGAAAGGFDGVALDFGGAGVDEGVVTPGQGPFVLDTPAEGPFALDTPAEGPFVLDAPGTDPFGVESPLGLAEDPAGGGGAVDGLDYDRPVVTETMADLYFRQGLHGRAAEVYRELLRSRPGDERLAGKLREAEARAAAGAGGESAPAGVVPGGLPEAGPELGAADLLGVDALPGLDPADATLPAAGWMSGGGAEAGGGAGAGPLPELEPAAGLETLGDWEGPADLPVLEDPGAAGRGGDATVPAAPGPVVREATIGEYLRALLVFGGAAAPAGGAGAPGEDEGGAFGAGDGVLVLEEGAIVPADEGGGDEFDRLFAGAAEAPAGGPARSAGGGGAAAGRGGGGDDDEDLEMFRAWLQNLKH